VAAEARRNPPRGPADPAADVENALARARFEERHHLVCRFQPSSVEVVQRGERVGRNRGGLVARSGPERGEDAGRDPLAGVVVFNLVAGHAHGLALPPKPSAGVDRAGRWLDHSTPGCLAR